MQVFFCLSFNGFYNFRMAVSQSICRNSSYEVEVFFTICSVDIATFSFFYFETCGELGGLGLVFKEILLHFLKKLIRYFVAPRPERSSFCETKWNKKAGVEGGNRRPNKKIISSPVSDFSLLLLPLPRRLIFVPHRTKNHQIHKPLLRSPVNRGRCLATFAIGLWYSNYNR